MIDIKQILEGVCELYGTTLTQHENGDFVVEFGHSRGHWWTIFNKITEGTKQGTYWVQSIYNGYGGSTWIWIQDKHFESAQTLKVKLDEFAEGLFRRMEDIRNGVEKPMIEYVKQVS